MPSTEMLVMLAALVGAGVFAGLLAGLLGVGGGLIVVPVIYQVLKITDSDPMIHMHVAVGSSLALIVPTALRSARAHYHHGAVDAALLRRWTPAMVAGVLSGVVLASMATSPVLSLVFACVALAMAVWLGLAPQRARLCEAPPDTAWVQAVPYAVGGLSSLMGIGGGSLSVPAMTVLGFPVHRAVGTSAAFGLVIAIPGALGYAIAGWQHAGLPPGSLGYVNALAVACLLPTTLLTVPLGVRLAHHLSARMLRRVFAIFLALVGLRMLWAALGA